MTRSITFNGITRYRPGGILKVNADALNQVGISSAGTVGIIAESTGGTPGSVGGLVSLTDPSRAKALFRDGALVDAIRLAFQSSGDPNVPGGAAEVVIYKVNDSTQSSVHIPDSFGSLVSDTSTGASTTTAVTVTAGGLTAAALTDRWVDVGFASLPPVASLIATGGTTKTAVVASVADAYVGQIVLFDSATTTVALQDVAATVLANDGTTITFAETLPAAVAATDDFVVLPTYRRKVASNTATVISLTQAFPAAPAASDPVIVRPTLFTVTSKDYGAHTEGVTADVVFNSSTGAYQAAIGFEGDSQLSGSLGGNAVLQLQYRGGANAVAVDTVTTPSATTATLVTLTAGGLTPSAHDGATVVLTDPATGLSEQVRITSNTATALTLESPGLSAAFLAAVQGATTGTVQVAIKNVTEATASITGASGAATQLTTAITGVAGDNLAITIAPTDTLQSLIDQINQNSSYVAAPGAGVNAATTLASAFDFGPNISVNIQKQISRNGDTGFTQSLAEVVAWFVGTGLYATAARYGANAADGAAMPVDEVSTDYTFATAFSLEGGTRGTSSNSSWQAAFDLMLTRQVNEIVPMIDEDLANEGFGSTATWASVSQQLLAHVASARGAIGLERGAFIGFKGTKAEYIAALNSLNDADIQVCSQYPNVVDSSGTLVRQGPRSQAMMGASMRAGVQEIGEPLTHKYIRTSGITQDSSWNPSDATDAADLIRAGAFFAETIPGKGTRWVRDLTSWVKDDNLCYSEGSVRSVVRYVAYNTRTLIEDRFTGKKASPALPGIVREAAAAQFEAFRDANIIVDSTDPATGITIRAYHNLKVYIDGDVLRLRVGIFPVLGVNFQLSEIFLQLATQSA